MRLSAGPIFKPMESDIEPPCLNKPSFINPSERSLSVPFFFSENQSVFSLGVGLMFAVSDFGCYFKTAHASGGC